MAKNLDELLEERPVNRAQVDTLRRYVEAIGASLRVEVELGDQRIRIA